MLKNILLKYLLSVLILFLPLKVLSQVHVSLPDTSAKNGTTIIIPVLVTDLTNLGVKSYEFTVSFDKAILKCKGIKSDETLSDVFLWSFDTDIGKSKVRVKASGIFALKESGTLIYLKFEVVGSSGGTDLTLNLFKFNRGNPSAIKHNGKFSVYTEKILKIVKVGNGSGYITINNVKHTLPIEKLLMQGNVYKLQAFPEVSSNFVRWSGDIVSTENPYNLALNDDTNLEVRLRLKRYEIITNVSPENSGSTEGSGKYNYGQTVTLKTVPNTNWNFINWTENLNEVSSEKTYSFVVTKERTLTANFAGEDYIISADIDPANSGVVHGIGTYPFGEVIELIAEPNDGWKFLEWVDDNGTVSNRPILVITVAGNQHYTAKFGNNLYSVVTSSNPIEGGVISGGGYYYYGQTALLSATSNNGWEFSNWTVNEDFISNENKIEVEIIENTNYQANFQRILYTITTSSNPIDAGNTTGGGFYFYNQNAQITSTSNEGWTFSEWIENDTSISKESNFSINIKDHKNLVANYILITDIENENNKPTTSFISKPFPNPFNPSTNFRFGIAKPSIVNLSVFDMNGKLVVKIINSELFQPGTFNRTFSLSNLGEISSGVYFYRFNSAEYNSDNIMLEAGKLLLIK